MLSSPLLLLPVRAAPQVAATTDNKGNFPWQRGSPAAATGRRGHPPVVFAEPGRPQRNARSGTGRSDRGVPEAPRVAPEGLPDGPRRGPTLVPGGCPDRRGDAVRPPAAAGHPPTGEPSRAPGGRRRAARVRRPCGPAGPTPRRPPDFFFPQPRSRPPAAAGRPPACGGTTGPTGGRPPSPP